MPKISRPRRSILYMPGSNARALVKGRTVPADGLILDLEDSIALEAKEKARDQVMEALAEGGYGYRELIVRVNTLGSAWGRDDIVAIASSGADAILLPKVESADMVRMAQDLMDSAGAPEDMAIWCMMETPLGTLHAEEIAFSTPRLGCFVMGTSDLAKDLHAAHTRQRLPMITSLGICLLAARAAGLPVLDGVYLDLADDEGFEHACRQGVELGFDGKTLIHPKTIKMANRIFSPTEDEVAWSRTIIKAHYEAAKRGEGVVVVDGKLIENLHVANAERLVAMYETIAAREKSGE
ncbi:MAG: CoA ester lyase [Rhodospirillaceae bacterium]|nr:CoA ester lyase [Rhodospirillaceae bacterium]